MIPPRGCLVKPSRGSHRLFHPVPEGWILRKRERFGATSTSYRPLFSGLGPVARVLKNCYGMLNVLPPVVSVKRIHLHIVARKCHTYPIWKIRLLAPVACQSSQDLTAPGGSEPAFGRGLRSEYARSPGLREAPSVRCAAGGCLQWHIDVLELSARTNAAEPFRGLDNVVARLSGMFAAEGIGKDERFGKLTGSNNEARAVNGPCTFNFHKTSPLGRAVASCVYLISWLLVRKCRALR